MQDSWDEIEKPLRQLLGLVKKGLSAAERREVEEFIDGNECGAAMEALVDILAEKHIPLSRQSLELARKLAQALDLDVELARISKMLVNG
ncbi:hypothetical protein FACS1894206_09130 [Deltaproteobacteria bacterium]|nr:hypothetical protein FACS1894206_09130 [Deltaproteobacteria bacterium]